MIVEIIFGKSSFLNLRSRFQRILSRNPLTGANKNTDQRNESIDMKTLAKTILGIVATASLATAQDKPAKLDACTGEVAACDKKEKDIVDTAVGAGSFKTLAAALGAAGLVDTLKGDGPFTVLAPTDAAFAKLPAGTVEEDRKSVV